MGADSIDKLELMVCDSPARVRCALSLRPAIREQSLRLICLVVKIVRIRHAAAILKSTAMRAALAC